MAGALVAVGFLVGPVAFIASGEMAVAFFLGHVVPSKNINPLENHGELAALFAWLFLFIAARGAGVWSIDAVRTKGA